MPGDYNGDGFTDIGVFRPSTGAWFRARVPRLCSAAAAMCRCQATTTAMAALTHRRVPPDDRSWFLGTGVSYMGRRIGQPGAGRLRW